MENLQKILNKFRKLIKVRLGLMAYSISAYPWIVRIHNDLYIDIHIQNLTYKSDNQLIVIVKTKMINELKNKIKELESNNG